MRNFFIKLYSTAMTFLIVFVVGLTSADAYAASDEETTEAFQQITVTGTVVDENGDPMPGVNIIVKGTTTGTFTDADGKYTLSVPNADAVLEFTFIGYATQEVKLGNRTVVDISMEPESTALEEIVVVGYGTQKKISVTGAITSVESESLLKSPSASVSTALAGRVTGIASVQLSGQPGLDEATLYVRGIGSLTASASKPLMLVDGIERSFTQLDPSEIESISILKDASATAVYGIRGANGVIIVTTKRGQEGTPKISFTQSVGMQMPTRLVETTDSYDFAIQHNKTSALDGDPQIFTDKMIEIFRKGGDEVFPNTKWIDYLVKPVAMQSQTNFNISGGTEVLKYFVSLGYLDQDGQFNTFDTENSYQYGYKRYNYRINLDINLTKTTQMSVSVGGRSGMTQQPHGMPMEGVFTVLYWAVPYSGMLTEDGRRLFTTSDYIGFTERKDGLNAIGWGTGYRRALNNTMNIDLGLIQNLDFVTKGLKWRAKYSNNSTNVHNKERPTSKAIYTAFYKCDIDPSAVGDSTIVYRKEGIDNKLGYSEWLSKSRNWYFETAFSYDRKFGNHNVTGLLLYNQSKSFYPSQYSDIPTGYVGMAARATYDYRTKYLVDVNLGYNGSENFAEGNRFGFFPAVSVGWTITEEPFMKDKIGWLSFFKLRASVGSVGNDRLGSSRFLYLPDAYSSNDTGFNGRYSFGTSNPTYAIGASEGTMGNPRVTWEKSIKQNYGFDARLFNSNLSLGLDIFYEKRSNILTRRNTVPALLSIALPAMNLGVVENKGFETDIKWRRRLDNGLNYNIGGNVSFARNKIIYMDEIPQNETWLYKTGGSVGRVFGYVFDAFWSQAEVDAYAADPTLYPDHSWIPRAGDARYKDLNSDGVIDSDDRKVIGYPNYPEWNASFSAGFDFKGFDFSILWTGVTNVSRVLTDTWRDPFGNLGNRALTVWLMENSWTPETAKTALAPVLTFSGKSNNSKDSNLWVRDASYIRLKNMEIGYTLPSSITKKFRIASLRFFVNGYNLLTFDHIKFMDPEGQKDYPLIKIVNFGLNVSFN